MRVVIETRKDVNANVLLKQLFKHTQLQDTFGVNMLALVDNQPRTLNLKEMLVHYLNHQKDVVTRRTKYELNKAKERAHILEGLLKALDFIDEVISMRPIQYVGIEAQLFLCRAMVEGRQWLFELKYTVRSHSWCFFRRVH